MYKQKPTKLEKLNICICTGSPATRGEYTASGPCQKTGEVGGGSQSEDTAVRLELEKGEGEERGEEERSRTESHTAVRGENREEPSRE